jgi:GNAT superfamily N-acetyltransferase
MRSSSKVAADPERAEGSPVNSGADKSPVVEAATVPAVDANDGRLVAQLVDLINRVYAEAEKGIWRDGAARTDARGVAAIIRARQLAVARLDGGAVRIQRLDGDVGEFGMLVASPEYRGIGIGRELVAFRRGMGPATGA